MMRRSLALIASITVVILGTAASSSAGGPTLTVGVAEDAVRAPDLVGARGKLGLLRLAGFSAVRITSQWQPGITAPPDGELGVLRSVTGAAALTGMRVFVSIYHPGSRTTPLTPEAQDEFAGYVGALVAAVPAVADVIIGNEPNLNRFWLPQFAPDGSIASAPAYATLLAKSYDAAKGANPGIRVWGGATAARGSDRPTGARPTTSPTAFIQALGAAYRASGRALPVMDGYAHHPYPDTSAQSPTVPHPGTTTIGVADYDKLVALLGTAFDGTPQPGSALPILYAEFGVETAIPAGKAAVYTGAEPTSTRPVDEATQARSYREAAALAFCQPNVAGLLFFHAIDENTLPTWQSGVYYADGTPKSSLYPLRDALRLLRGGSITRCEGLALPVGLTGVRFPTPTSFRAGDRDVRFRCALDCSWEVRVVTPTGGTATRVRGFTRAGNRALASFDGRSLGTVPLRFELAAVQPVNPGAPTIRRSAELTP